MRVALKFDVLTRDAVRAGMPAVLQLLDTYRVQASFAVATGSQGSGWLAGFGTPIEREARDTLRAALAAGHEIGLAAHRPGVWTGRAARAGAAWTEQSFRQGVEHLTAVLGRAPAFGAAPGWQVNPHLLILEAQQHWSWCSDTRGRYPFLPLLQGVRGGCVQIPTTLPTVEEVVASGAAGPDKVHEYLYAESRHVLPTGHVFSADVAQAGLQWLPTLEKLIVMWKGQDGALRPLGRVYEELALDGLPLHQIGWGQLPGRSGHVAMQSLQVPK